MRHRTRVLVMGGSALSIASEVTRSLIDGGHEPEMVVDRNVDHWNLKQCPLIDEDFNYSDRNQRRQAIKAEKKRKKKRMRA